jgi:hypothetical protein
MPDPHLELVAVIDALTTLVLANAWIPAENFYATVGPEVLEQLQQLDVEFHAALIWSGLRLPRFQRSPTADYFGAARVPYHRYGAPVPGIVFVPDDEWSHAMRCLREAARQAGKWNARPPGEPSPDETHLTATERAMLAIIRIQPKGKGISGKEIIRDLHLKHIALELATLRRHVLPKLCQHFGVINQRAAGGYLIPG